MYKKLFNPVLADTVEYVSIKVAFTNDDLNIVKGTFFRLSVLISFNWEVLYASLSVARG